MDKVALGQVLSEYFGFPANSHTTDCSTIIIIIWGWYNRPNNDRGTKWTQSHPMRKYINKKSPDCLDEAHNS
jgi:hypothetical protein